MSSGVQRLKPIPNPAGSYNRVIDKSDLWNHGSKCVDDRGVERRLQGVFCGQPPTYQILFVPQVLRRGMVYRKTTRHPGQNFASYNAEELSKLLVTQDSH